MANDDGVKEFTCHCGKSFIRQLALQRHVDTQHSRTSMNSVDVQRNQDGGDFATGSQNSLTRFTMDYSGLNQFDGMANQSDYGNFHSYGDICSQNVEYIDENIDVSTVDVDALCHNEEVMTAVDELSKIECEVITFEDMPSIMYNSSDGTNNRNDVMSNVTWSSGAPSLVAASSGTMREVKLQMNPRKRKSDISEPPTRRRRSTGKDALASTFQSQFLNNINTANIKQEIDEDKNNKEEMTSSSNRLPYVCRVCKRDFNSEKYLSMHMALHKYADSITATESPDSETGSQAANSPNPSDREEMGGSKGKRINEPVQWECPHCKKVFTQNSNYKNHMRTHSDERPFVCDICSIGFKERYHLKKHVLFKHTTDLKETCRICGKCFKDSTAVRAHERIHSEVRPYGCTLCGKTFKTSECLWHHENRSKTCGKSAMKRQQQEQQQLQQQQGGMSDVVEMPVSMPVFEPGRKYRKPRQNVQIRIDNGVYSSSSSSSRSSSSSNNNNNIINNNNGDENGTVQDSPAGTPDIANGLNCDMLRQVEIDEFDKDELEMLAAMKTDPDQENLLDMCGSELLTDNVDGIINEILWDDMERRSRGVEEAILSPDTGYDPTDSDESLPRENEEMVEDGSAVTGSRISCAKCGKHFLTSSTLEKHMEMHSEERPFKCNLCDNGFKLKVHLKKHNLYRHSDEYPCECSICGKKFKDSSAVRLHERIHSSDRPFKCHCGKGFKTRENLWGHKNRGPCDKSQEFLANNIRLFRSAEFGPILGVPIASASGPLLQHVTNQLGNRNQPQVNSKMTVTIPMNGGQQIVNFPTFAISSTDCRTNETNNVDAFGRVQQTAAAPRQMKIATLRVIKPRACPTVTPIPSTCQIPTAIVTPLQRNSDDGVAVIKSEHVPKIETSARASPPQTSNPKDEVTGRHAPSPNTVNPGTVTRSSNSNVTKPRSPSIAEKCPTVQRYLTAGSASNSSSIPGIHELFGNAVSTAHQSNPNPSPNQITTVRKTCQQTQPARNSRTRKDAPNPKATGSDNRRGGSLSLDVDPDSRSSGLIAKEDPVLMSYNLEESIYTGQNDFDDINIDPMELTPSIDEIWSSDDDLLSASWPLENEFLLGDFRWPAIMCDLSL